MDTCCLHMHTIGGRCFFRIESSNGLETVWFSCAHLPICNKNTTYQFSTHYLFCDFIVKRKKMNEVYHLGLKS